MGLNSDIDLLVIKSGKFNRDRVVRQIYRRLSGTAAVDALVVTPEEVKQYGQSPYLVIFPALREGKVVYWGVSAIRRPIRANGSIAR